MTRICDNCHEHFEPTEGCPRQRFCCAPCRHRWRATHKVTGPRQDRIPVAPVREAVMSVLSKQRTDFAASRAAGFETRDKLTYSQIAIRLWGARPDHHAGDTTRLKRALGIKPHSTHKVYGNGRYAETINAELAVRILRCVGVDPHEAGL